MSYDNQLHRDVLRYHRAAVAREARDREAVRLENGIEFFFLPLILHTVAIKMNISK